MSSDIYKSDFYWNFHVLWWALSFLLVSHFPYPAQFPFIVALAPSHSSPRAQCLCFSHIAHVHSMASFQQVACERLSDPAIAGQHATANWMRLAPLVTREDRVPLQVCL